VQIDEFIAVLMNKDWLRYELKVFEIEAFAICKK